MVTHNQIKTTNAGRTTSGKKSPAAFNVLFACPPDDNSFLANSIGAIESASCEDRQYAVAMGTELFWNADREYDVVNLQWPESIFGRRWILNRKRVIRLCDKIKALQSKGTKVCITRHNIRAHDQWSKKDFLPPLYRQVDGVIHLGTASRMEFQQRYGGEEWESRIQHAVVPHPGYFDLRNEVDRDQAKAYLGIEDEKKVILVFGAVRSRQEANLVEQVFSRVSKQISESRSPHELLLLAPRWLKSKTRLSEQLRKYGLYQDRAPTGEQFKIGFDFVHEDKIQMYLGAADVVFVPRCSSSSLNSGIIPLALTFGRVVVGPAAGVMGEMLRQSNNPTFDDEFAASKTIAKLLQCETLFQQEQNNAAFAREKLSLKVVGQKLTDFYSAL